MFKVFYDYDDYYKNNFVGLNREFICTKTYQKYRATQKFNSFIFGSSRSHAFKCENWKNYLDANAKPFHFDASADGIYGLSTKVRYIDEMGDSIKDALVVIDRFSLVKLENNNPGHLFISPPALSKESSYFFYTRFLKASFDSKFLMAFCDYSLFHQHRDYMGTLIINSKYPIESNKINCDLFYGHEKEILEDSLKYYTPLVKTGVFERTNLLPVCKITDQEIKELKQVKEIFARQHTNYKIIISPVYDQIKMEPEQLALLNNIFGKENVYDFSGINEFTNSIGNYYEWSHFRPAVANKIMSIVYNNQTSK